MSSWNFQLSKGGEWQERGYPDGHSVDLVADRERCGEVFEILNGSMKEQWDGCARLLTLLCVFVEKAHPKMTGWERPEFETEAGHAWQ